MPQTIETGGTVELDREFDELWRQIKALQKVTSAGQANLQPPPAQVSPITGIVVQDSSGSPSFQVSGLEFNSADGAVVSQDGPNAKVTITVVISLAKSGDTPLKGAVTVSGGTGIILTQAAQNIEIKIDAAALVTSLAKSGNTPLVGDVTLSAGAGITLTQVGNDISISSP
jgi:hypothetical protein